MDVDVIHTIGSYDTFSGTSMACPYVAGTDGQLMTNGYSNTTARDRLRNTAESIGLSENESGYDLLDTATRSASTPQRAHECSSASSVARLVS